MAPKRKRTPCYSEGNIEEALEAVRAGAKFNETCRIFGIPKSTLRSRLKGCQSWTKKDSTFLGAKIEIKLAKWFKDYCADQGFRNANESLKTQVKEVLDAAGETTRFKNNKPGDRWVRLFKKRHNLPQRSSPALRFELAAVAEEKKVMKCEDAQQAETAIGLELLQDQERIFNAAESGFQHAGGTEVGVTGTAVEGTETVTDHESILPCDNVIPMEAFPSTSQSEPFLSCAHLDAIQDYLLPREPFSFREKVDKILFLAAKGGLEKLISNLTLYTLNAESQDPETKLFLKLYQDVTTEGLKTCSARRTSQPHPQAQSLECSPAPLFDNVPDPSKVAGKEP